MTPQELDAQCELHETALAQAGEILANFKSNEPTKALTDAASVMGIKSPSRTDSDNQTKGE